MHRGVWIWLDFMYSQKHQHLDDATATEVASEWLNVDTMLNATEQFHY